MEKDFKSYGVMIATAVWLTIIMMIIVIITAAIRIFWLIIQSF